MPNFEKILQFLKRDFSVSLRTIWYSHDFIKPCRFLKILKSSTLNKITKYWYVAILAMLVIGIGYSYFAFTTDATENMNNFNAIQIVIPIVIITLVVIIMQKKRIKIQTKKDSD